MYIRITCIWNIIGGLKPPSPPCSAVPECPDRAMSSLAVYIALNDYLQVLPLFHRLFVGFMKLVLHWCLLSPIRPAGHPHFDGALLTALAFVSCQIRIALFRSSTSGKENRNLSNLQFRKTATSVLYTSEG